MSGARILKRNAWNLWWLCNLLWRCQFKQTNKWSIFFWNWIFYLNFALVYMVCSMYCFHTQGSIISILVAAWYHIFMVLQNLFLYINCTLFQIVYPKYTIKTQMNVVPFLICCCASYLHRQLQNKTEVGV